MSDLEIQSVDLDRSLSGYDYELPEGLIAQNPVIPRDSSRLLVVDSPQTGINQPALNYVFRELLDLLQP